MKKLLMLTIAILGTTAMVNAQAAPASTTSKEVKATKHAKKKAERKADKKVESVKKRGRKDRS